MKFLHTSDWHVGRQVRGRSRDSEHQAALAQVLAHAREQSVDCVLVAGDVYDSSAPPAEAERIVYEFFRELRGAGIPAVVIAGNHDHPRRFEALAPLLDTVRIHLVGEPRQPGAGGVIEVESRDCRERAAVAALPWVPERLVVDFARLPADPAQPLVQYADQLSRAMSVLCEAFSRATVNVLVAHALVGGAAIGAGGGERALHLDWGVYGLNPQGLPAGAQYIALGHVHKAQDVRGSPAAYSGSLLQLDFGEAEQAKSVNLVEVRAGMPAEVARLPITAGRQLRDVGSAERGVALHELAAHATAVGDAWLRVFADADAPVANLTQQVRAALPNAVHVERAAAPGESGPEAGAPRPGTRAPEQMFRDYYVSRGGRGQAPAEATVTLFRSLLDEAMHATAQA